MRVEQSQGPEIDPAHVCSVESAVDLGEDPRVQSRIMYVERKNGGVRCDVAGGARIGRVRFSKSGKTLYYCGRSFRSLEGAALKANYYDVSSGEAYWLSGCRRDGNDALYPTVVEIDHDVREEYWRTIRDEPERMSETSFRSEGKHTTSRGRSGSHEGARTARLRSTR